MEHAVNGWFAPDVPLAELLEKLSQAGGTHHSVLVYGDDVEGLELFAEFWELKRISLILSFLGGGPAPLLFFIIHLRSG